MYSVLDDDDGLICKAKGIKKSVVKQFNHQKYIDTVHGQEQEDVEMNLLRQKNHEIFNITVNKKSLSNKDDKRHYLNEVFRLAHFFKQQ